MHKKIEVNSSCDKNLKFDLPKQQIVNPVLSGARQQPFKERSGSDNGFFVAKDNFWTSSFLTTASSRFLESFSPAENATVIKLLENSGFSLLGKAVLDEFACGGTGLLAEQGYLVNPLDSKRIIGGSSSGSAAAVALKIVPFSLAHDTGDSIRRPASYCGIIGFKPSYGLVSRYGVIPMASSLDTVGIVARDLTTAHNVFKIISVADQHDLVTISARKNLVGKIEQKKVAVIANIEKFLSHEYALLYLQAIETLSRVGFKIQSVSLPEQLAEHLQLTYLIICSSELVSHLNSLQGITFGGTQNRLLHKSIAEQRTELLGRGVKERIILGTYFLENKWMMTKAQQLRSAFTKWTEEVFKQAGFLVFPGTVGAAPFKASFEQNNNVKKSPWIDNLLLLANFSGNPSLNIPLGLESQMPVSLNIDSSWGNDEEVFWLAKTFEKAWQDLLISKKV